MERKSPSQSATLYKVGTKKKGIDGNIWIIVENVNGVKRWKKLVVTKEIIIRVSYGTDKKIFPKYAMKGFPKTWKYDGFESAMSSQPKWQTNNAYFYGPDDKVKEAKASIKELYEKYKEKGYVMKFVIKVGG